MSKVVIIAEAGVNHNGSMEYAHRLIDAAADAGADYIKFQTFKTKNLVSETARKAEYQIKNSGNDKESQFDMLRRLELSTSQHEELIDYCAKKEIKFFSTAFDLESLDFLKRIGLKIVKVPSGEITNLPYLRKAAALFDEVIISTGMCTLQDIKNAVAVFELHGTDRHKITILHCTTEYPTPFEEVNLKAMLLIGKEFGTDVGYSDHTLGTEIPVAAVALGAKLIEKHITLDRKMKGPDHSASLEPEELKTMVEQIRNVEKALNGTGLKEPSRSELKNMEIARKSIVARKFIKKGELLSEENLTVKRPGTGISPMRWDEIVGLTAAKDYNTDDLIK